MPGTTCHHQPLVIIQYQQTLPYVLELVQPVQESYSGGNETNSVHFVIFQFSGLSKHCFSIEYDIHIWQVLPQLGCSDAYQI